MRFICLSGGRPAAAIDLSWARPTWLPVQKKRQVRVSFDGLPSIRKTQLAVLILSSILKAEKYTLTHFPAFKG